jgi:hypothetical protein
MRAQGLEVLEAQDWAGVSGFVKQYAEAESGRLDGLRVYPVKTADDQTEAYALTSGGAEVSKSGESVSVNVDQLEGAQRKGDSKTEIAGRLTLLPHASGYQ